MYYCLDYNKTLQVLLLAWLQQPLLMLHVPLYLTSSTQGERTVRACRYNRLKLTVMCRNE